MGWGICTHQRERWALLLPVLFFLSIVCVFVCVRVYEVGAQNWNHLLKGEPLVVQAHPAR